MTKLKICLILCVPSLAVLYLLALLVIGLPIQTEAYQDKTAAGSTPVRALNSTGPDSMNTRSAGVSESDAKEEAKSRKDPTAGVGPEVQAGRGGQKTITDRTHAPETSSPIRRAPGEGMPTATAPPENPFTIWNGAMEVGLLLVTAVILILGVAVGILNWQILSEAREITSRFEQRWTDYTKEIREDTRRLESGYDRLRVKVNDALADLSQAIDTKIEKQILDAFTNEMRQKVQRVSDAAKQTVNDYLEKDFTADLEKRYLAAEYVRNSTWSHISARMTLALQRVDQPAVSLLWTHFFRAQLGLRQMLSADPRDVFTGLGILRVLAKEGIVPGAALWDLICLLKEQRRLSWENMDLARALGREIGRTFADCRRRDEESGRGRPSRDTTPQPADEKGDKPEDSEE